LFRSGAGTRRNVRVACTRGRPRCHPPGEQGAIMSFILRGVMKVNGKLQARDIGEYPNFDEAVRVATQNIDDFLYREYKRHMAQGISARKLYEIYKKDGEIMLVQPKINKDTIVMKFDAFEYATRKCGEIGARSAAPKSKS
jgi:hypothetical protein